MHALACRGTVSTKWTHDVPKASANIHLSAKGRVDEREKRRSEYVLSLSATCATSLARSMEDVKFSAIIFMAHTRLSSPRLATCPFYIQRSIIQCAAAPCNAATLATTCHCLLHNCRHLAGINYSSPRLTRCLIRKRM